MNRNIDYSNLLQKVWNLKKKTIYYYQDSKL